MKPYVQIAIRTKSETIGWGVGEAFVASLSRDEGLLVPEQVSHNADKFIEPFMGTAASEGDWAAKAAIRVNGVLSDFYQDFAWRRKKAVKCSGSVVHTARNARGQLVPGAISFRSVSSERVDWYSLFKAWCEIFPPQLGMLHLFSEPELGPHEKNNSFQIGSFNSALKPDVPNIGWVMFYGDEFSAEVDAERIAASGFPIEKLNNGYLVRVTESLQEVASNFPLFSKRRAELKSLFREDLFLIKTEASL
ncbi:hypothetical protein HX881_29155 [Pseudomonas gingeri]|uniref:hypothetical protein n=1 Tax=Pseudomonas gingeri TaxID=117681 RepID=UPI0015A2CA56|nr:hypothetical protein [Pseudomonas gingeri]NVZ29651.1 hypothetical protein [Pseudomonas gingeri]